MEENDGQNEVLPSTPFLSGRNYEYLKIVTTILLPAIATLYLTLGAIWNFPKVDQVVSTITALTVFLGVMLKVSSVQYNREDKNFDGVIVVDDSGPRTVVQMQHTVDPRDLTKQGVFKVVKK